MNHRRVIRPGHWCNLDCCVLLARCCPTNEKRNVARPSYFLHFLRVEDHFVQGWCNEARKANDVGLECYDFVPDVVPTFHYTNIFHLEVVTTQDHCNDVLADIM